MTETFEEYASAVANALYDAEIVEQTLRVYIRTSHDLIAVRARAHVPYEYPKGKLQTMSFVQLVEELRAVSDRRDPMVAELAAYGEMRTHLSRTTLTRHAVSDENAKPRPTDEDITEVAEFGSEGFRLKAKLHNRLQLLVDKLGDAMAASS